jgi:hypothetical protein
MFIGAPVRTQGKIARIVEAEKASGEQPSFLGVSSAFWEERRAAEFLVG